MDLTKLPDCPFEARQRLLQENMEGRTTSAVLHISEEYRRHSLLVDCISFVSHSLMDAPSSEVRKLRRVGFFPWVEATRELDQAINQALLSNYKVVYDHVRRAVELVLVGAFFTSSVTTEEEAIGWMQSDRETPMFSRALKRLLNLPRYQAFDSATSWSQSLSGFYWQLCDVVHVRGLNASFNAIQPSHSCISGVFLPEYNGPSLDRALDTFVSGVQHIATIVAVSNPILLVGLPIDEKFGINPPASGFFNDVQAARLASLLIPEAKPFLENLIRSDPEIVSVTEWFLEQPDLSDEEFEAQVKQFNQSMGLDDRQR